MVEFVVGDDVECVVDVVVSEVAGVCVLCVVVGIVVKVV